MYRPRPLPFLSAVLILTLCLALACAGETAPPIAAPTAVTPAENSAVVDQHLVAEATLAAHYIAAALEAGQTPAEINATLQQIANDTVISEFWISDANGDVEFSSVPGADFSFGADPDADRQAAEFVNLLLGREKVVVQTAQPRDLDGAVFQYVGVAGVDGPRIVQVGLRAAP